MLSIDRQVQGMIACCFAMQPFNFSMYRFVEVFHIIMWLCVQGDQQHVTVQFPAPVIVSALEIRFQGGFAGKDCVLEGRSVANGTMIHLCDFYPEDINSLQISSTACCDDMYCSSHMWTLFSVTRMTSGRSYTLKQCWIWRMLFPSLF